MALVSAIAYGLAGPVGRSLLDAGWSPSAVALARIGGAALLLMVPTVWILLRARSSALRWAPSVLAYGIIAIAGVQVCFYTAIGYAPVSSVLLIEYLAPVLLIFWTWLRTRQAPGPTVLVGAAIAVFGLAIVIGVLGGETAFTLRGSLWAFGATVCLTAYFALAAGEGPRPPTLVLTGGGMMAGSVAILLAGLAGLMPLHASLGEVVFAGVTVPFLVPVLILALVCAVLAYLSGIAAVRILGTRVASFASLSEVIFALTAAWWLLGEQPGARQAVGGLVVLAGIVMTSVEPAQMENLARQYVMGAWVRAGDLLAPAGRLVRRYRPDLPTGQSLSRDRLPPRQAARVKVGRRERPDGKR
ncbi:MAG: EamA family transporter [Actinomycetales bacterium]